MELLLALLVLFFSVVLHEISHGYVALLNGDPTAKAMKRLSLNPLRHVDLVGTVILPLALVLLKAPFLFGWAKPVPYNPRYFKNESLGLLTVGLAGVAMNFALALLFGAGYRLTPQGDPLRPVLAVGVTINVALGLFNLIPIPPLDGSRALGAFLPKRLRAALFSMDRAGLVLLFALFYLGMVNRLLMPLYRQALVFFGLPAG